jgi:hypothetical protein
MKEEQNMNGEVSKRQRAVRIGRLTTLSEIATEIGKLYRVASARPTSLYCLAH